MVGGSLPTFASSTAAWTCLDWMQRCIPRAEQPSHKRKTGKVGPEPKASPTNYIIMKDFSSLLQLAKECPGLQVSITLGDLVEAIQYAIAETKRELEQDIADSKAETYITREKVMEITGKSAVTIWRWQKEKYLVPASTVGGTYRYRMSDVRRIMEGGDTQEGDAV